MDKLQCQTEMTEDKTYDKNTSLSIFVSLFNKYDHRTSFNFHQERKKQINSLTQ